MTTKNSSKPFKGKINGQRLPPILIANKQLTTTTEGNAPNSILKKPKADTDGRVNDGPVLPFHGDDDCETSRIMFQKTQEDVLLLLDTYPPKTWIIPKCLKPSYDHTLDQGQRSNPSFETLFSSENSPGDLIDAFPSPLSDRIASSRYCRRSVASSCSRRSSIIFQRHTTIPVDAIQLRREESFDTLCESLTETHRSTYALLPPIPVSLSTDLTKSLTEPIIASTDHPLPNLTQSLSVPPTNSLPSVSPPLITSEETPDIQEKKEEFTRKLLSKSLHREPTNIPVEKPMNSPTVVQKSAVAKPLVAPRVQKSIVVDSRRLSSVERQPVTTCIRTKLSTAASTTAINHSTHQRLGKVSLDIFQPHSKSTVNIKKCTGSTNKCKSSIKPNVPKVKISTAPPREDEKVSQSNNDVIPSPPSQPLSASNETSQTMNTNKSEEIPSSTETEQVKLHVRIETKRQPSGRPCSHYSHPVPKPLTLQGEKTVDADYPEAVRRTSLSTINICQRRGSLKGQPLITELFEEPVLETSNPVVKPEPTPQTRPSTLKLKKPKANFMKNAKTKKPVVANKPKPSTPAVKIETKSQSTNTELDDESETNENMIVIGGPDWVMTVKPQIITENVSVLSQSFDVPTVDDEDLPVDTSPTDHLAVSQTTVMTSIGNEIQRQDSLRSEQATEISPVLTQLIEPSVETTPDTSLRISKPTDPSLINSDIRTIYETVRNSIRKDTSLRSLSAQNNDQEVSLVKPSLPPTTTSSLSHTKTLPFEPSASAVRTYNNSDTDLSIRPAFRVVNDSLNSRGSETIDSTSSHEDYSAIPLCTENDCDEIYRTARKGRPVGKGAYGTVWSYLTITGRMIAVKEIELDEGDSDVVRDDYESVREEIYILRALNHSYVVKFLGISLESTRLVKIFMEYLPNGTIENLLQSFGPFHNDVLKKYTRQLVEGVSYLHDNGVVHRDIKGKNIMLDVDGNIKLIDFGCAKRLKKNQNTHSMGQMLKTMRGTAHWMAPEVIAETGHGKKADIWSIGCTLCEMATGKPPWSFEHNQLAILLIIANGTKPPIGLPDTCPPSAHDFFRLCLTRDPAQRPSARDLLLHPFLAS